MSKEDKKLQEIQDSLENIQKQLKEMRSSKTDLSSLAWNSLSRDEKKEIAKIFLERMINYIYALGTDFIIKTFDESFIYDFDLRLGSKTDLTYNISVDHIDLKTHLIEVKRKGGIVK